LLLVFLRYTTVLLKFSTSATEALTLDNHLCNVIYVKWHSCNHAALRLSQRVFNASVVREDRIPVAVLRRREVKWLEMLENWEKWMSKRFRKVRCTGTHRKCIKKICYNIVPCEFLWIRRTCD